MPSRLLREGILDSEPVNALSPGAEVFYRRLMSVVDDFGRFDGRTSVLKGRMYTLKLESVREADIARWIAECEKAGLIALYVVDSKPYILFHKLGSPRALRSKYPPPPQDSEHTFTDESGCLQAQSSVPNTGSGADTSSGASNTPLPPVSIPPQLDSEAFRNAWDGWKADRRDRGIKPYTPRGESGALKKLAPHGVQRAIETIDNSIAHGWQGLFPEKRKGANTFETHDERVQREMGLT